MYTFAVLALLALATLKLVDLLADHLDVAGRFRSLLTFVVAIGAVLLLDWSMFEGFGTPIRDRDLGLWTTGFVVAGATVPWRALLAAATGRARSDEAFGDRSPVRKAA